MKFHVLHQSIPINTVPRFTLVIIPRFSYNHRGLKNGSLTHRGKNDGKR